MTMTAVVQEAAQQREQQHSPQAMEPAGSSEKPQNKHIRCVVPGCATDVSAGPHYLRRHKICQFHLKAKAVTIDDRDVRFCQQCGRFQPLADFKDDQRSCEAALQAHNARRRVKKDANGNCWSSARKGRGSKRALAACPADDPSSSEDGAVGASRKSAQPRRGSQRSAPAHLQRSQAAGSDSFKGTGSEGNERPLSDGACTVEQNGWTSNASPDNSYGSPEGFEQQQQQQQQLQNMQLPGLLGAYCTGGSHSGSPAAADPDEVAQQQQLNMLLQMQPQCLMQPADFGAAAVSSSMPPGGAGRSRLGMQQSGTGCSTDYGMPACCGAWGGPGDLHTHQDLTMGSLTGPSMSQAQQMLPGPTMSCNPSTAGMGGLGSNFGQGNTLEAWMMPQSVMQQQAAQLQQYWSPPAGCSTGLEEAIGQSMMLQQAMQEQQQQQMMMTSQPQLQQQAGLQLPMHNQQVAPQQQQQQQQVSGLMGSAKSSKMPGTESSGTNMVLQDLSVPSATTASAEPCSADPTLPATSAAAAAALANDPLFGALPMHGANSSSSLSLLDGLDTSAEAPDGRMVAEALGSGTTPEQDNLLEEALAMLLAGGPDWQMDDILMVGPQEARSGTHSQLVPPATTSSPSSSNANGGNNLSGPLSVPSLPSASASQAAVQSGLHQLSAQTNPCGGMAAAAAGLIHATDALRVGSPGKAPGSIMPPAAQAQAGCMLAAGDGVAGGASVGLDDLIPPVQRYGSLATGMDLSVSVPPAAPGFASMTGGGMLGGPPANLPTSFFPGGLSTQLGGLAPAISTAGGMVPGASMFGAAGAGGPGGVLGGAAAFGGMHPGGAGGAMPGGMPAAAAHVGGVLGGMPGGGGTAMAMGGMAATGPMAMAAGGMGMQHAGPCPQMESSFQSMQGPSLQAMWQQQQQQQDKQSLLLQQQLMMQQQQQQAEYLRLQQQQQIAHRQQLMRLQQQINSTMTYSQQLVRLSIKLHGVTPDQLPASTVLAMERLLVNNAADIEMILLQPSLRQGCIQFELDVLVKCPQPRRTSKDMSAQATSAQPAPGAGADAAGEAGLSDDFESGAGPKVQQGMGYNRLAAVVAAFNDDAATQAAEALLRQALPVGQLVQALLGLPLVDADADEASDASSCSGYPGSSVSDSEDGSSDSDTGSSDASSSVSSGSCRAPGSLRDCVQAVYAQVGDSLGIWRADSGVVQEWSAGLSAPGYAFSGADASSNGSNWRPVIQSCMPLVSAVAGSSAASSPTAAAAAHNALKPLPLTIMLHGFSTRPPGAGSGDGMGLWCTRRGQFLMTTTREAPAGGAVLGAERTLYGAQTLCQAVTGLLDSTPGMLLLQAEQLVQLRRTAQASTGSSEEDLQWGEFGLMSGLVPVLLCPSAAMAAECNVLLQMADNPSVVAPKVLHLGLVLDFWAMHQQLQQQQLAGGPRAEWQEALLNNVGYLKTIKALGTQLLLSAVVSGMSATSAHLHAIMLVVRELHAQAAAAAPAAPAAHAHPTGATGAEVEAPAQAPPAQSDGVANTAMLEGLHAAGADAGDAVLQGRSAGQLLQEEGSSAAAAAGLKPVQEWVFEEVDCKGGAVHGSSSSDGASTSDSSMLPALSGKSGSRTAAGASAAEVAAAVEAEVQQSPYVIFRGAAQMLAMLLVMYLLLEVAAAVYKGRSPAQLLLLSLTQLKELLGIMLVPLAMMCLGGVLAVWQFGLGGGPNQADQQPHSPQRVGSLGGDSMSSKGSKSTDLPPELTCT